MNAKYKNSCRVINFTLLFVYGANMLKEILQIPNLISLFRVFITPVIGYYLYLDNPNATLIAVLLMFVAGISDALDGYAARKLNLVSDFGIAFDPICDKIFAIIILVFLLMFREFPLWLAGVIIGRDLLIVFAGWTLLKGRKIIVPSNLTGKYTFAAIALLLGSSTIRFQFGIETTTYFTIFFTIASLIVYFRVFQKVKNGEPAPQFHDSRNYALMRTAAVVIYVSYFAYKLWQFLFV